MVEGIGFVQPREKQTQAFQHLEGCYRGDGVTLFTRVHSDNTSSNRHNVQNVLRVSLSKCHHKCIVTQPRDMKPRAQKLLAQKGSR
ncbi:hypothetical protein QYF61_002222 [Mycteria americana]|uniref:Uncharacterized protein n=1 Tax=Mycteria americana TaxID=33587 RepID=A0AAN7S5V9_MYCAM|nr:hypothetical protein QYF61_002222 [Mycteria americana]